MKTGRSNDGLTLLMTSLDGFCSNVLFNPGELGQIYSGHVPTLHHPLPAISTASSSQPTPTQTPTTGAAPLFEKQAPSLVVAFNSPAPSTYPSSPTRSNSASSSVAPSSQSQNPSHVVISNPTPTVGNVPSVAAPGTSFGGLPWTTPPQTPMAGLTSTSSSVGGVILGKRDTSESEKEDSSQQIKKRRIAPTLVSEPSGGS